MDANGFLRILSDFKGYQGISRYLNPIPHGGSDSVAATGGGGLLNPPPPPVLMSCKKAQS